MDTENIGNEQAAAPNATDKDLHRQLQEISREESDLRRENHEILDKITEMKCLLETMSKYSELNVPTSGPDAQNIDPREIERLIELNNT